jgi:MFS transporter, DHA1 family, multidrug resistance protein
VRDLFVPRDGIRVLSQGLSGLGVIALASPLIGGLVVTAFGWRAAFAVLWLFAAATLAFIVLSLPETIARKNPHATRSGPLLAAYARIARDPTFLAFASLTTATYAGLFTYLAASSFVLIEVLGLSRMAYGLALASSSLAYLVGTFACRHWLARHGVRGAIKRGSLFTLAGGLSMAGLALAGVHSAWAIVLPQALFVFGHGIHQPCGQAGAVGPFPHAAGTAAALNGFVLAMGAFGVGAWLGVALDDTVLPMTLAIGFWALVTTLIAWTLVQRHGDPAASAKS